jgi:hypothetical protein
MTTTTDAPDRAEINRRNAQKSTGPRTPEGKNRSKFNALKHGMSARTLVLPGEDPAAFQDRIDTWTASLGPENELEQYLAEQAAQVSWQLDRARRAEAALLASSIRQVPAQEAFRQQDEALALGRRLFWDPRGPLALYPHAGYQPRQPRVSDSGLVDDPDDPARLVLRLESTAAGCRWLLARWAELRALLERGLAWQAPDKLKAIRLLGKQPLDAVDEPEVATIFLAVDVLRNEETEAFAELEGELLGGEASAYQGRLSDRRVDDLIPPDEATARATLLDIVAKATARLEALAASHRARAAADDVEQTARLAFDRSEEGERMRRHQASCARSLSRTLDTLLKIRRDADRRQPGPDRAEPAERPASESVVATYASVFFGPDGFGSAAEVAGQTDVPRPGPVAGSGDGPSDAELAASHTPCASPHSGGSGVHAPSPMPHTPKSQDPTPEPTSEPSPPSRPANAQNEPTAPQDREDDRTEIARPEVQPALPPPVHPVAVAEPVRVEEAEGRVAGAVVPDGSRRTGSSPCPDTQESGSDRPGSGWDDEGIWSVPSQPPPCPAGSFPTRLGDEPAPAALPP